MIPPGFQFSIRSPLLLLTRLKATLCLPPSLEPREIDHQGYRLLRLWALWMVAAHAKLIGKFRAVATSLLLPSSAENDCLLI